MVSKVAVVGDKKISSIFQEHFQHARALPEATTGLRERQIQVVQATTDAMTAPWPVDCCPARRLSIISSIAMFARENSQHYRNHSQEQA